MADLIYTAAVSLDGYVVDADDNFDWAAPDDEVHAFVNDLERPIGTYLYGRRLYEVMTYWETAPTDPTHPESSDVMAAYTRLWQAADKVVYSSTLEAVTTERTTLERTFDPDVVRHIKEGATSDLSVGGPTLAANALRAGLVDHVQLLINPVIVGGGTGVLPDDVHIDLELVTERRFTGGVVFLHYRVV